jgi:gas vesicle protein
MAQRDTTDFLTALAVGALVGAGAALLLRPTPRTRTERLMKEIEPYRKRLGKNARSTRKRLGTQASALGSIGQEMVSASRDILGDFRGELASLVSDARRDLARMTEDQVAEARKAMRRTRKRIGS